VGPFIDAHTRSKVIFVTGDCSVGTQNESILRTLVGDDWKVQCGVDQPVLAPGCSPGYDHATYWQQALEEERLGKANEQENKDQEKNQENKNQEQREQSQQTKQEQKSESSSNIQTTPNDQPKQNVSPS